MARKKRSTKTFESVAEMDAHLDAEDLGTMFEKHGRFHAPTIRKINVDLPQWLLDQLDLEAARAGVSRQPLIKLWLVQKLDEERNKRTA